jgi:iron complex outermembrane receptor protein
LQAVKKTLLSGHDGQEHKYLLITVQNMKKNFFVMKLIGMMLFIACIQVQAGESYDRTAKVSVQAVHAPLVEIFSLIEKQSEYLFFYVDADVEHVKASVNVRILSGK